MQDKQCEGTAEKHDAGTSKKWQRKYLALLHEHTSTQKLLKLRHVALVDEVLEPVGYPVTLFRCRHCDGEHEQREHILHTGDVCPLSPDWADVEQILETGVTL